MQYATHSTTLCYSYSIKNASRIEDDDEAFKEKIKKFSGFRTFRTRFKKRMYDNGKENNKYFKVKK